ncbi:NAD(P)/FAD-dependent oxidoreductase [Acidocella sp.]|uniref:flavin-containing monooxygenase n=1 Tax=Acidocella sp. TaxID=50710 RepID=UPI00260F15ED|nr:NAD(P)/FAD-dependent oxidoreductase [Acidocella sp.]
MDNNVIMETGAAPSVQTTDVDVLVVGAGFAGLYQLHKLRQAGFRVKVIEAGSDIGGIWHWNRYPGARVDSHGAMYQYSDPDLWKDWAYKELYPGWEELRAYFDHVDAKWDLRKDVVLSTRVTGADFDESTRKWTVHTDKGGDYVARSFVLCTGFASKPYIPEFEGMKDFKGEIHHTGLWPQQGVDMRGKRVAVIGMGASGVQVMQEAGAEAKRVTHFLRTPCLAIPMWQRQMTEVDNEEMRKHLPEDMMKRKQTFGGFNYDFQDVGVYEVDDAKREEMFESIWKAGGFWWWLNNFNDVLFDERSNRAQYDFWRKKVLARIKDPRLAEIYAPEQPPHPYGVKRPSLEQNFYEVVQQDNVDVVDLKQEPIVRFTEKGIQTTKGEYEFDIIVLATGFDAVSGGLTQLDIRGTAGRTLGEKWRDGVRTHLGMASREFPNLYFIYGPQSPSGFCNGPTAAEAQGDELVKLLVKFRDAGITRVEAKADAEEAWRNHCKMVADMTLFPKADSWYMGANIPGKPRELLMYPSGLPAYLQACEDSISKHFAGFEVSR